MSKYIFYSLFLFVITFFHIEARPSQPYGISKDQEMHIVKKTIEGMDYLSRQQNDVWSGYNPIETPTILTFESGSIYAINFKSHQPVWRKITIGKHSILYTKQDRWGLREVQMNPSYPMENQNVFVLHCENTPEDILSALHIFIHERFHQYQFEQFQLSSDDHESEYTEQFNVENLALMQLEERILDQFINETERNGKIRHLKDYLIVRHERRNRIGDAAIAWEDNQQKMEGLADYVAFKLFDNCPSLGNRGLARLQFEMKPGYDMREITERAVKWRHYGVGATLGYALDFLGVEDWKSQIENGTTNLATLLESCIHVSPCERGDRMKRIRSTYQYDRIHTQVNSKIQSHMTELRQVRRSFNEQSGVSVVLGPPLASVSGGGSNTHMYHLDDGAVIATDDTSVSTTSDNGWCLKFNDIPFVYETKFGDREFKMEDNVRISVDNKKMTLKSFLTRPTRRNFRSISWKGANCEFQSSRHPGQIISEGGKVTIQFHS